MSRFNGFHRLPALAILAVLTASPRTIPAQSSAATPPDPAPAQLATQAPAQPAAGSEPAPATPPTPEQLGDSLSAHQRYQAAITAYSKVPDPSAEVWNKLGIAYQMMFNPKDAIRCYTASLKLDPHNATVLNNLATVYDSLKQYGTAERYYRKAIKIDSHSALVLRNLGSNQLAQRKTKKGWDAYQAALKINPQIFETRSSASVQNPASAQERGAMHYYMAKSCVGAGNPACAIQNLRLALNEGYTNPKRIADDSSFASLRELPAFQQLIAAQSAPQ
jgi:tetratricopeptide (TPR) repeat protein